jgi:hypothetical protein
MCRRLILLTVLMLGLVSANVAVAGRATLIGWWTFDEGSGNIAADSSGKGNDGTIGGTPQWATGTIGGALNLSGDDYVAIDGVVDDITSTDITLSVWIQSTQTGQGDVIAANDGASGHPLEFYIDDGGYPGRYDGSDVTYPNAPRVGDGQWHMMTLVREGNEGRIYVDGVLAVTYSSGFSLASVTRWSIGQEWDDSTPSNFYTGLVDDVRFYDGALSSDHVLDLFNGIEPAFTRAMSPDPADGALYADTWASLAWTAGDTATSHDVYMSENFDEVNDRAAAAFQGNQALPFFTVGFPGFAYPDGMVPGTTYYWAVDEVEADGVTKYVGRVWSFSIPPRTAYNPSPRDGAKAVQTDVTLSWTPGFGAKLHTVYFGDDLDTVSNATGGAPTGTTRFTPGALEKDKVYYWRVDEFNPPELVKGNVWTFRTMPEIVITNPDMIGWWKLDSIHGTKVLDWSGYGNDGTIGGNPQLVEGAIDFGLDLRGADYVSLDPVADDLTSTDFTVSIWIRTTQGGEGNVIASNTGSSHVFQFGVKGGNIWVDDGPESQFTTVNDDQWHMITFVKSGSNGLVYADGVEVGKISTTINVTTEARWSIGQEWDSGPSDFYVGMVDDARFFNKALTPDEVVELMRGDPLVAWNPKPASGKAIDVEQAKQPLTWSPGDNASQHDVYLSMDKDALDMADTSTADIYRGRQAGASYSVPGGLEWGTGPYYWRIDEINADGSVSGGSIWSFSVADYLIVEDFEGYTDDDAANEAIWQHWIDGFGVSGNGAQVGYLMPPYAEKTIVHGGDQSMPLMYTNTGGVMNSEAVLSVSSLRNWTLHEVGALSIWFRGNPASVGSFTEAPVGTFTMTGSGTDIWGNADEFHFAYKMLSGAGSIIARVNSVGNTNAWAKAGVMIRESLDPGSTHCFVCVTPGQGASFQRRLSTDGTSSSDTEAGITAPHWVKLERDIAGNFTASRSTNGSTWVPLGTAIPERILMGSSVYVGLAVTSHDAALTCEAKFSNVTTTGNVTGQWTSQDIGITSNAAAPLYVSVANATGAPAVVAHPDPAAATIDVWTEWVISLQDFAGKGINLANIDKIAVGLGSQSGGAAAGGSGTVYLDDFRLYRTSP